MVHVLKVILKDGSQRAVYGNKDLIDIEYKRLISGAQSVSGYDSPDLLRHIVCYIPSTQIQAIVHGPHQEDS